MGSISITLNTPDFDHGHAHSRDLFSFSAAGHHPEQGRHQ
jgi:hypothetical protein